jgi:acyl-CoA thioester hydrolase
MSHVQLPAGPAPARTRAGPEVPGQPGFAWRTRIFFDDLDAMGMLHNARYLVLAERASSAFFEASGWRWERDVGLNPDQHYVVREQAVQYLEPVTGPCGIVVEMWVDRLGETSAAYGFEVRSADRLRVHARLQRVHVKLDPASLRPAPWTPRLRGQLEALRRPAG